MNTDFKHLDLFTPEGFRELYDACYESLAVYAVRMTANSEAAEDIVQSVFVDLWERSDEIADDIDIRAFLYMSVRNRALDFIRHQKVKWRYAEMLSGIPEGTDNPDDDDEFFTAEVYQRLFNAIDELSPRQREIFSMYMSGKKNHDIADAMGIAEETVRVHKLRAIHSLRKRLGANEMLLMFTLIV